MEFITQHLALVVLVIASGLMVLWPEIQALLGQQHHITPLVATQLINQKHALVLDCRKQEDFALGHIPQSRSLDMDQAASQLQDLKRFSARPVILVPAASTSPNKAVKALKEQGFSDILVLKGGITAWIEASLPVDKSAN